MQNKKAKNLALASQNVQPRLQGKTLLLAFFNINSYLGWIPDYIVCYFHKLALAFILGPFTYLQIPSLENR